MVFEGKPLILSNSHGGAERQITRGLERKLTSFPAKYEKLYDIEPQMEDDVILRFEAFISEIYDRTNLRSIPMTRADNSTHFVFPTGKWKQLSHRISCRFIFLP